MTEVLHIVNRWRDGGVERFVKDIVSNCTREDIRHAVLSVCTSVEENLGCPTYGPLRDGEGMVAMARGGIDLRGFLERNRFDAVHVHTNNSSGFLYAGAAARAGLPLRIVHSHSSSLGSGQRLLKGIAQKVIRALYAGSENVRLACSAAAGEHLFPGMDYKVVPNGVDIEKFRFDVRSREEIRLAMGVSEGEFLVGCVGSLVEVKNHMRALSIVAEVKREVPSSRLIILGDGGLRGALEAEVVRLGITGSVLMPGFVDDAYRWYSAMDALLFPSLYEGLPIALVEAQCNGLPVICSDTVTEEVALLETFSRLPLSASDERWAAALLEANRDVAGASADVVRAKGFGRETMARMLLGIYRGEV